jgi:hypothetical protein
LGKPIHIIYKLIVEMGMRTFLRKSSQGQTIKDLIHTVNTSNKVGIPQRVNGTSVADIATTVFIFMPIVLKHIYPYIVEVVTSGTSRT